MAGRQSPPLGLPGPAAKLMVTDPKAKESNFYVDKSGCRGSDESVQGTNDDATGCKRFAVQAGYWKDAYIACFARNITRKTPEINRGYFARVHCVKSLVDQFIDKTGSKCQILSLGAGFDSLYWRLCDDKKTVSRYIEVDFPAVTARKVFYISRSKKLQEKLDSSNEGGQTPVMSKSEVHSDTYHLVNADLRNVAEVEQKLGECGFDKALPTLVLAECVLVYMDVDHSSSLLSWLAQHVETAFFVNYEQMNMEDRFGQVMLHNLDGRGCPLRGVAACASPDTQANRFTEAGWEGCHVTNMAEAYRGVPAAERGRIEKLEFLDEVDLFWQLLQHYCIATAWKDGASLGLGTVRLPSG